MWFLLPRLGCCTRRNNLKTCWNPVIPRLLSRYHNATGVAGHNAAYPLGCNCVVAWVLRSRGAQAPPPGLRFEISSIKLDRQCAIKSGQTSEFEEKGARLDRRLEVAEDLSRQCLKKRGLVTCSAGAVGKFRRTCLRARVCRYPHHRMDHQHPLQSRARNVAPYLRVGPPAVRHL